VRPLEQVTDQPVWFKVLVIVLYYTDGMSRDCFGLMLLRSSAGWKAIRESLLISMITAAPFTYALWGLFQVPATVMHLT
jgi:hypothetical protein